MDKSEIEQWFGVSASHSLIVDVVEWEEAPGVLRTVTIHRGNSVTIEFERARAYIEYDMEGGGLKYIARYGDLDEVIQDLEEYLGKPMREWRNFSAKPYDPTILDEPDWQGNRKYFEELVRREIVPLPHRAKYCIAGVYWRHIAKYGEFRRDKLLEEQEERLTASEEEE